MREDLWRDSFRRQGQRYDEHGTRIWHPGLSLRVAPLRSLGELTPFLHGTTGEFGPVVVRGISVELGRDHAASFGHIVRPARLTGRELTQADPGVLERRSKGLWFHWRQASRNEEKPKVNEAEMKQLTAWAQKRGLL